MEKKRELIHLLGALLVIPALCFATPKQKGHAIKIQAEIRPEVNYVTHLYTLAGLGFSDAEYCAKYAGSLPQAAVDTLQKYKEYLVFGQGEGGMLTAPFFFGVSAATIPNADSLRMMMHSLMEEGRSVGAPEDVMAAAQAIANVYVDNYDHYLKHIYPQAAAEMESRRDMLNRQFEQASFVEDWERVTGYSWQHGDYHWLLYRAGERGPSYNNLNESTNTVYYNQPIDYQKAMFSHEFGIFLMQDSINPIFEEMKEFTRGLNTKKDMTYLPWSAFESLACWYNCKIAGKETDDYRNFGEADVQTFCQLYDHLSKSGITSPSELYRKAVLIYTAAYSIEEVADRMYTMTFKGDYGLDDFIALGGAASTEEMLDYLRHHFLYGMVSADFTPTPFGCSYITVKNTDGNTITGRNFDWPDCYSDIAVVHTLPDNGYASVSTVNLFFLGFEDSWKPENMSSRMQLLATVYSPLDGMNEKGLVVADLMAGDNMKTDQQTPRSDLTTTTTIRLLLDKAQNVEEALRLLESYDMHSDIDIAHHLAISDTSGRSVVVEWVDNQMLVAESPLCTNHYLAKSRMKDYSIYSENSHYRLNRMQVMKDIRQNMTVDDITEIIQSVASDEMTRWSAVYDSRTLTTTYYQFADFSHPYTMTIINTKRFEK